MFSPQTYDVKEDAIKKKKKEEEEEWRNPECSVTSLTFSLSYLQTCEEEKREVSLADQKVTAE